MNSVFNLTQGLDKMGESGGRGRAQFWLQNKENVPGEPPQMVSTFPLAGRGRAMQMRMMMEQSRPSSSSGSSGSVTVSTRVSTPQDYSVSPTDPGTSSRSPTEPGTSAAASPLITPSSSVPPSTIMGLTAGRGRAFMLASSTPLAMSQVSNTSPPKSTVESVTSKMAQTSIGDQSKACSEITEATTVKMHGESGQKIRATANYINLEIKSGCGAFEYEVKFEPKQDAKAFCIKMLRVHRSKLGPLTFDGVLLFLPTKLPDDITVLQSPHPVTSEPVSLKIIFKKQKKFGEMKHLYNILFKRIMSELKLVEFKRQYYDPKNVHPIPQYKLEIWPGYVTAVDEYEGGVMLCIDPSHKVLRKESVLRICNDLARQCPNGWEKQFKAAVIGQTIMTTYNNKTYIVDDVDFTQNPLSTFPTKDGPVSFMSYYKKNYGIDVTDIHQPLLINRKERRNNLDKDTQVFMICLIPEFCNLTGISDEMRSDFSLMKEMAKYTRITPNQRYFAIRKFVENVNSTPAAKQLLADWGLYIRPDTVELNARTLQPEQIIFGNTTIPGTVNADWGRDASSNKCITPIDIDNWIIIHTKKDYRCTKDFIETFQRCCPPMGIKVSPPQIICLESDKPESYSVALKKAIRPNTSVVVCICPTARDDRYTAIKKTCCVENPIPSQVINSRTLCNAKNLRSVVQKIALQINCKLGGTLWAVNIPFKQAMVIGIDVYHGAGQNSCAGFVASYNASMTRWVSHIIFQEKGQEIIDGLKKSFIDALKFFYKTNGMFPTRIILYRDGVGDGQLSVCQNYEVPQLQTCFALVDPDYNPPFTFIVVQKRINTRIFADYGGQLDNPNPGTVLDNTVTRKSLYDFFLVSQKVRQGTVTPSHYVVLNDTNGLKPDYIQRFTYKLCHMYYNWPGTVRVPAPCQYAHKLAFLMGQAVKKEHDPSLRDKLFFL